MSYREDDFHGLVRAGIVRGRRMRGEAAADGAQRLSELVRRIFSRDDRSDAKPVIDACRCPLSELKTESST